MSRQDHWQDVYRKKQTDEVSWYQREPTLSLELIEQACPEPSCRLLDVGGGASTLVDHLLEHGGVDVTVVDVAPAALEASQTRLGAQADAVRWIAADMTEPLPFSDTFDVWHDRAVFHFLTDDRDRGAYLANLAGHLRPGGHAVLATFALDGPERCSGLPVQRYSAETLRDTLGSDYELLDARREVHHTPWGSEQPFTFALFRRRDA